MPHEPGCETRKCRLSSCRRRSVSRAGCGQIRTAAYAKSGVFPPRRVGICPGCGVIEDVPSTALLRCGSTAKCECSCRASMSRIVDLQSRGGIDGPSNSHNLGMAEGERRKTCRNLQPSGSFPPGPIRVVVMFMHAQNSSCFNSPGVPLLPSPSRERGVGRLLRGGARAHKDTSEVPWR